MFANLDSLTTILLPENIDASQVANAAHMFDNDRSLTSLDLSQLNTSNMTDMSYMFSGDTALTTVNPENWDTKNVADMTSMFRSTAFKTLDLSKWNTSKLTALSSMFTQMPFLTDLNLANWDVSHVDSHNGQGFLFLLGGDSLLSNFNNTGWHVDSAIVDGMYFYTNLSTIDLSWFDNYIYGGTGVFTGNNVVTKIILGSKTMEIDSIGGLDEVPIPGYSTNWYKLNADGSIDYSHNWDNYTLMGNNYDPETGEPTGQRATDPGTYVLIQTAIYAHDSTIKVGQTWNKNDNLSDSYDYHGNKIDPNNIQVVAGNVDTNTPGQYVITYSYTDDFGRTVTAKATVTVVPNDDGGTTPTDPTDPDNPTTPTDPTNPVEPGNPTEPNIPSTPLDPSEPNQPQPEEPSNPAMPDLPNTSVKPSNPGKQPGHDNHIN